MAKTVCGFQIPDELLAKIKKMADKNCISVSGQIRMILLQYFKEHDIDIDSD